MADEQLLDKIHNLSDLELAVLLSLIAREHCLVSTEPDSVDELAEELRLIASKTFNLSSAIISCHAHTTLDEFATGLFVHPARTPPSPGNTRSVSPYRPRHEQSQLSVGGLGPSPGSYFPLSPSPRIGGPISPISSSAGGSSSQLSQPRIANVVLAKDLDRAPRAVQIQALELLRTRRIFTRTSVQTAPKQFLFIAIVGASSIGQARVTPHLNDFFYLSHWHDPEEDGFPYLDEAFNPPPGPPNDKDVNDDADDAASTTSSTSVVKLNRHSSLGTTGLGIPSIDHQDHWRPRKNSTASTARSGTNLPSIPPQQQQPPPKQQQPQKQPNPPPPPHPTLTDHEISHLSQLSLTAHTSIAVTRYQANIVSFLRTHRAIAPGSSISTIATQHLARLSGSLAPLHGLDYVTPALVGVAARKVYGHRLRVVGIGAHGEGGGGGVGVVGVGMELERSVQWGSEVGVVRGVLEGVGVEEVLEEVLGAVRVPG
ncbi:uncharacterized protein B0H64DRAFT_472435 [Chaetomium fimeti]|uniref:Magnesium chelatase n=1 Tax=Chaetomium fimeti TaxID=1854472 RepID=A0AAE0LVM4_9PEZI|nr:hypothetical protein B0H64DRAFT_472435 [Chaetomium fimeti]